ncbi:MAG TPA: hypothetical protein VGJ22_01720, partial [Anaerolineales bacterium]
IYDQLPLLLIAGSGIEAVFLVFCSWLALPALLSSGGWIHMPINWQFWIVLTLYIPALIVLFWQDINLLIKSYLKKSSDMQALQQHDRADGGRDGGAGFMVPERGGRATHNSYDRLFIRDRSPRNRKTPAV